MEVMITPVEKTFRAQTGNDLSLSKASFYCYFPGKLSLYAALLKKGTGAEKKRMHFRQKGRR